MASHELNIYDSIAVTDPLHDGEKKGGQQLLMERVKDELWLMKSERTEEHMQNIHSGKDSIHHDS